MANWRDIKRRARASVHKTFGVPAVYLTHATGTPVTANVRLHSNTFPTDTISEWSEAAQYAALGESIVFDIADVSLPARKAFVVFSDTEIYRLGAADEPREGYVRARVTELGSAEASALVASIPNILTTPAWNGIL